MSNLWPIFSSIIGFFSSWVEKVLALFLWKQTNSPILGCFASNKALEQEVRPPGMKWSMWAWWSKIGEHIDPGFKNQLRARPQANFTLQILWRCQWKQQTMTLFLFNLKEMNVRQVANSFGLIVRAGFRTFTESLNGMKVRERFQLEKRMIVDIRNKTLKGMFGWMREITAIVVV
jgi:hypothetical protein